MFKFGAILACAALTMPISAQLFTPDTGFGDNGMVMVPFYGATADCFIRVVRPQPDGRLIAVISRTDQTPRPLVLRRYHQNGTLDQTFGTNGEISVVVSEPGQNALVENARIRPDGRILVLLRDQYRNLLVQFTADGALDPEFGIEGRALHAGPLSFDTFNLYIDEEGRALVVGSHGAFASVTRYMPDGSLDPSWGDDGIASPLPPVFSSVAMDLAPLPGGGYVVTGFRSGWPPTASWVARLDDEGQALADFGNGGYALLDLLPDSLGNKREALRRIVVRPDGSIVAVGTMASLGPNLNVVLLGLTPDGQYDTSFGTNGTHQIQLPTGLNILVPEIFARDDGRVLMAGVQTGPAIHDNRLVFHDFLPEGIPNEGFGPGGVQSYTRPGMSISSNGPANLLPNGDLVTNLNLAQLGQFKLSIVRLEQMELSTDMQEGSEKLSAVHVFPNPTAGVFHLHSDGIQGAAQVTLSDALGREVQHWALPGSTLATGETLHLRAGLVNGVYSLRIAQGEEFRHTRLLVQQ